MTSEPLSADQIALRAAIDEAVRVHREGRLEEAEALYREALARWPDEPNALTNLGGLRLQQGRTEEGVALIDASLRVKPNQPWALTNKAGALMGLGRTEEALEACRLALALDPDSALAQATLADGLLSLKRWPEAAEALSRVLERSPGSALAHGKLGYALSSQGRLEEALAAFDKAVALDPAAPELQFGRSGVLRDVGRAQEALEGYERWLALHPDHADALKNRAVVLADLRRYDEALAAFDALAAVRPDYPLADWLRSTVLLMLGRYAEGWRLHEGRLHASQRGPANRQWTGQPVEGLTVLAYGEQGIGDSIQMMRYVPLLADRGARVILAVQAPLVSLARSVRGAAEVICLDDQTPAFDLQTPLMSLPAGFGTTLETIPADVPYLHPPPDRIAAWAERLARETPDAGLRVGLVWSGGFRPDQPETWAVNRRRNIPLRRLQPLKTPGVVFYSLQKGQPAEGELAEVVAEGWSGPDIVDWSGDLHDMAETAALMHNLDLVITVDTSAGHLAGALGKPVWILNRFDSCWRWLQDRPDSPWYPTVRLFRQDLPAGWDPVIEQVARALAGLAAENGQA